MIAHVAEAGEGRGRVVLRYSVGAPSPIAIAAAVRVAQAFQSEIESLFIEDSQLMELAGHAFVREISFSGRATRAVSARALKTSFRAGFNDARRQIVKAVNAAEVPFRERIVCDEPVHAVAAACARNGPWNVIALAEALGGASGASIEEIFDNVIDATGLVLVGPKATRTAGPIVVAAEDRERLPGMLRAAERIAKTTESEIWLMLLADDEDALRQLEGEARLLLAERRDIRIAPGAVLHGHTSVAVEAMRKARAGFLIARFGGLAAPKGRGWRVLLSSLECPLFLVR